MGNSCGGVFFQNSLVKKFTRQVSKTSVSYKLSLQNEHIVRDILQKSSGKPIGPHTSSSPAKQFHDSSPSKHHPHAHTHTNPNVTATFTSTTTRNLTIPCACHENLRVHMSNTHKVLRLPRNVTSATPRNLTIPCACHEITLPHLKSCTKYCACQEK